MVNIRLKADYVTYVAWSLLRYRFLSSAFNGGR